MDAADASGKKPLQYVIVDRETFELLLANGADMNAEDRKGRTPLYIAIEKDSTNVVELLLDRGIDLKA